ncbi:caffeine-induced death protein 1 [Ophiostoma piceae UAMH 11346]|uniref:polynucleotide adenylyltransferase n=1 Tax=Ophiostoma piceae (strain UAMH 11346) TaxID=1262450 RepID=S3C8N9_OPHP1|nr:caffeine-induced death protein 1 [Ophiostoma piceae UAMH 11346]
MFNPGGGGVAGGGRGQVDGPAGLPTGPLEDRLRSMILNTNDIGQNGEAYYGSSPASAHPPATSPASHGYPPSAPGSAPIAGLDGPESAGTSAPGLPPPSPKAARKRPNQAQRRQMSAQLSIPIDHRTMPQSAGNLNSPQGFGSHNQFQQSPAYSHPQSPRQYQSHGYNSYQQQQQQTVPRPQSATVRPAHYGHNPMQWQGNSGPSGPNYPSQPRHHQSLSYQGPTAYDESQNWRARQSHQSYQTHQSHQSSQSNQSNHSHQSHPSFGSYDAQSPRGPRHHGHHQSGGRMYHTKVEDIQAQGASLQRLSEEIVASAEIEPVEIQEKENFRAHIERVCQEALAKYEFETNGRTDFPPFSVRLICFGSLSSGFATKASDMDLGLISPLSQPLPDFPKSPIPRLIEKAFLDAGLGARLLSRTRVPIIKLCEKPPTQLQVDLLDERARWEKGLLPDQDALDGDGQAVDDADALLTPINEQNGGDTKTGGGHGRKESTALDDEPVVGDKYDQVLAHLKQPPSQTLGNYYAAAKRTLRKLGGRDITHSTVREFKDKDLKILTDVGHAFVDGLADEKLKARLFATASLATSHTPSVQNYRSLYGVLMQAEGEALAMLWDTRATQEKDIRHEDDALDRIQRWNNLQNKATFHVDLLGYNKELQLAVEGLRKIPSLQLMTLEQGQYESPALYHERVGRLLSQSGGRDAATPGNTVLPVVIQQYIAGIWNHEIKDQVSSSVESMEKPSLRAVARRHKSLQLALEFEKALGKNCYSSEDAEVVQAYVTALRQPLQKCDLAGRRFDYVVPSDEVTSRARQLLLADPSKDPSKLGPNQPRDPYKDRLEFPKAGLGVQCDINFSAHLALQNSLLLRCYSHTDSRVRPLVLFVKHWAKMRGINTPYRGTLSSYGYVLMMLHYLVNIAQPFVCPNLQQLAKPVTEEEMASMTREQIEETVSCRGHNIQFWRKEAEIRDLASKGLLNQNEDTIGDLLRGFFEYYAQSNFMSTVPCRGFDWGRDVLSIRTVGGLRSKQEKGWTGARTVIEQVRLPQQQSDAGAAAPVPAAGPPTPAAAPAMPTMPAMPAMPATPVAEDAVPASPQVETKEVKHRYLFAIEDPFELEHNVARTVTHGGIVAIRDEFRRAWRIIKTVGASNKEMEEKLLGDVTETKSKDRDVFGELLNEIHGPALTLQPAALV